MSAVDKNQKMVEFLQTCPTIRSNPLFFNFGNIENNAHQVSVGSDEIYLNKTYLDGSQLKRYTFNIDTFKSVAYNPIVTTTSEGTTTTRVDENVDDLSNVQLVLDWINTQGDSNNFPDFGTSCIIEKMETQSNKPNLLGVDTSMSPPMAVYRISIQIDYIDKSKQIWN